MLLAQVLSVCPIYYILLRYRSFISSCQGLVPRLAYFCCMKLFITLSLLLGTAVPSWAQFNTVASNRTLYKVEIVRSDSVTASGLLNEQQAPAMAGETTADNDAGDSRKDSKNEWIRRYLSVSYPLSDITVSSSFGVRTDPFTGKKTCHNGLDLKAGFEEVYSIMEGVVVKVSADRRSGRYVTVRYGDYTVSYCHLSRQLVQVGRRVMPGEVIAVSGNSGRSTGPHLHLTVKRGRKHIDPAVLLQFVKSTREEAIAKLSQ